jgi:ankyrin repeat protein
VVERELQSLPKGLSETYVRIMQQIENQSGYMRNLALNCLAWTIHARKPLEINELRYALAISLRSKDENIKSCLQEVEVILGACGSLLEEVNDYVIRPIHYTVQEFLMDATQQSPEGTIRAQLLDLNSMHTRLSLTCLDYIHETSFEGPENYLLDLCKRLANSPFATYACQSFDYHISQCSPISENLMENLERLLRQDGQYLAAVLQIKISREGRKSLVGGGVFNDMRFPVTAATIVFSTSLFDVPALRQQWTNGSIPQYVLHLAASGGHASAVLRLLEVGCDIDEKDAEQRTPLYHACYNTNLDIVKILLNAAAEINAQGGYFGNALQAASYRGHEPIVKLLLDSGADVNAQGGLYSYALYAASYHGYKPIVKLLLDSGADINAQGGLYSYALQAASYDGHEPVVKLLLDSGADVNAPGGTYGSALQAASLMGREQTVKLLLEAGADVNAESGQYGYALQAASCEGHEPVVKLLLDSGADINAQGGEYDYALQAASAGGCEPVVKLLLESGAIVNAQGETYGSALQVASLRGQEQIVKLLLEVGADVNAQGGKHGAALQGASYMNREQIVKLLLEAGADVDAQSGGGYATALQVASSADCKQILKQTLKSVTNSISR